MPQVHQGICDLGRVRGDTSALTTCSYGAFLCNKAWCVQPDEKGVVCPVVLIVYEAEPSPGAGLGMA